MPDSDSARRRSVALALECEPELRTYIHARLRPGLGPSVDDLLHEVWIQFFRRTSRSDVPRHRIPAHLKAIAKSRILDHVRRACRSSSAPTGGPDDVFSSISSSSDTPSRDARIRERADVLRRALRLLPANLRHPMRMRHIEGLALAVIARRLRKTVPAVRGLLDRGRRKLRERLGSADRYLSG